MSSDLSPRASFPDVVTGEALPATPSNAHHVLSQIAEMEAKLRTLKAHITDWVLEESQRQGTKTLYVESGKVVLEGGPETVVDGHDLALLLRDSGLPEERIAEVVEEIVTYKVNRRVLNQMAGANENYRVAAEMTTTTVEKPYRAKAR